MELPSVPIQGDDGESAGHLRFTDVVRRVRAGVRCAAHSKDLAAVGGAEVQPRDPVQPCSDRNDE